MTIHVDDPTKPAQLTTIEQAKRFILAGNARFTLRSPKTGERVTYRVRVSEDGRCHFVSVLSGANNEDDYVYLGQIINDRYSHGRKSKIAPTAKSAVAASWFFERLLNGFLHPSLELFHEGRCGRCGRVLTTPESITRGLGPECAGKM